MLETHAMQRGDKPLGRHRRLLFAIILQATFLTVSASITTGIPFIDPDDICTCPCIGVFENFTEEAATTVEQAKTKAVEIEKELKVDKATTTSTKRTKVSAIDQRKSSRAIGILGIAFVSVVFGSIIILDLCSINKDIKKTPKKKPRKGSNGDQSEDKNSEKDAENPNENQGRDTEKVTDDEANPLCHSFENPILSMPPFSTTSSYVKRGSDGTGPTYRGQGLSDSLKQEDLATSGAKSDMIRIRALAPPYGWTNKA